LLWHRPQARRVHQPRMPHGGVIIKVAAT